MTSNKKGFFRQLKEKYDELCKDLGVEGGACRGCVPIVKFDPEKDDKAKQEKTNPMGEQ